MEKIRWGILGTGRIARAFAGALAVLPDAELAAVGSRTRAAAQAFGDAHRIPRRHGSYAALAQDPGVDAIYIATPHPMHRDNCLECLRAGKAVLCEKPFAINAAEAREMIALAREKKIFLMEAMWSRFFPAMEKVRSLLAEGALDEVRLVTADFGFKAKFNPKSRQFDPALGGGSLLDVGVYPVSFASMVYGQPPVRIVSAAQIGSTGVDEQAAAILDYPQGGQAVAACSFRFDSPREAHIVGTGGRIRIHRSCWSPDTITLTQEGREDRVMEFPFRGNGYTHEAEEVMRCLREGKLESGRLPLRETLWIMETMDSIRAQWGLKYPSE